VDSTTLLTRGRAFGLDSINLHVAMSVDSTAQTYTWHLVLAEMLLLTPLEVRDWPLTLLIGHLLGNRVEPCGNEYP